MENYPDFIGEGNLQTRNKHGQGKKGKGDFLLWKEQSPGPMDSLSGLGQGQLLYWMELNRVRRIWVKSLTELGSIIASAIC